MSADKVIIANGAGMAAKYSPAGLASIRAALDRLIAADAKRGLHTTVLDIDDAAQLAAFGITPIINATDQAGVKRVIDAIDAKMSPDYFLLLDGPDVVPHITLSAIPGLSDGDPDIPSDLPYASSAPMSNDPHDFLAVTRVVGRLPSAKGCNDAGVLVGLIDFCATQASRPASDYASWFALSTDAWKVSTQLSLSALSGPAAALNVSPTAGHSAIDASLPALTHLINCHGATNDNRFYGQQVRNFPIAMNSAQVAPHIVAGTIAAAECCFGAELYDPILSGAKGDPMSMVYLTKGAVAYVGSTNTAYGPSSTNGQADLMVQYFLDGARTGASTGRAMLQARQRFIKTQKMADPRNLKTVAQFVLLGDPSLVPVIAAPEMAADAAEPVQADIASAAKGVFGEGASLEDVKSARKSRRISLKSEGTAIGSSATYLGRHSKKRSAARERATALARQRGFKSDMLVFDVTGGPVFRQAAKSMDRKQQIAVACEGEEHVDPDTGAKHRSVRVLVAQILGDGIVSMDESVSR